MLATFAASLLALSSATNPLASDPTPQAQVRVDSARHEVVITVAGIAIPEATPYAHHGADERLQFAWPVGGWIRGYRIDLLDSAGHALPREMIHHAVVANLDRRQLTAPAVERLIAVGRETEPFMMPASMGVPLAPEQRMLLYYGLVNTTDHDVRGAALRITLAWTPERAKGPKSVLPLVVSANPVRSELGAFDVPPGVSTISAEFTLPVSGRVRVLGGHLHDYAVELRLEEVETGKVLARLRTKRDAQGRLKSVSRSTFLFSRGGLRLHANRRYRVVSVYENPTCATIPSGGMAALAGPFAPDDVRKLPALDSTDTVYVRDVGGLLGGTEHAMAPGHDHEVRIESVAGASAVVTRAAAGACR